MPSTGLGATVQSTPPFRGGLTGATCRDRGCDAHPLNESRFSVIIWLYLGRLKGVIPMGQKRHTPEQIIQKLRRAEVEIAQGSTVAEAAKKIEVTEHTYYRWRAEYGGLRLDQAKRLKELEKENARLKKLVGNQALDIDILKEAASGNF